MISDFEAYLLSQMRGKSAVEAFLATEGMSLDELARKADHARKRWRLDQLGYAADALFEAVGPPATEETLPEAQVGREFAGSVRRLYQLRAWPRVSFCVNRHPQGYAWGECFVQNASIFDLPSLLDLRAWEWTVDTVERLASRIDVLDHWGHQKDFQFEFPSPTGPICMVGKFDFDLLQEWTRRS